MSEHLGNISQRSEGPTPDSLGLKLSGSTGLDLDLRRTQEVEITVRGTVAAHTFEDKRDKNGDVAHTVKWAKVTVDELVEISVLRVPRRMRGQTTFFGDADAAEAPGENGEVVDAEVVAELNAGEPPEGVDPKTGEITDDGPVRHPQVPEPAWAELNHEQQREVLDLCLQLEKFSVAIIEAQTPTDRTTYTERSREMETKLLEDYGIVLLEPDEAAPVEEPPPPARVDPGSPPVKESDLRARREWLLARTGLTPDGIEVRDAELAEIDRRLEALGASA